MNQNGIKKPGNNRVDDPLNCSFLKNDDARKERKKQEATAKREAAKREQERKIRMKEMVLDHGVPEQLSKEIIEHMKKLENIKSPYIIKIYTMILLYLLMNLSRYNKQYLQTNFERIDYEASK